MAEKKYFLIYNYTTIITIKTMEKEALASGGIGADKSVQI